jgi:hypothetical protein
VFFKINLSIINYNFLGKSTGLRAGGYASTPLLPVVPLLQHPVTCTTMVACGLLLLLMAMAMAMGESDLQLHCSIL